MDRSAVGVEKDAKKFNHKQTQNILLTMMFFLYIFSIEKQILFSIEKIFRVFSMGKNFFSMENCFG